MNVNRFDFSQWMSGTDRPDRRHRLEIAWHLEDHARATLTALGLAVPDHRANLLAAYTEQVPLAAVELNEQLTEWVRSQGQRRASKALRVARTSLRDKIAGRTEWLLSEVIDWARRAGLLLRVDESEKSVADDESDEPAGVVDANTWRPGPRLRVRDERNWLGDAVEEADDEFDDGPTDDEDDPSDG
jgi:hypothetical protein